MRISQWAVLLPCVASPAAAFVVQSRRPSLIPLRSSNEEELYTPGPPLSKSIAQTTPQFTGYSPMAKEIWDKDTTVLIQGSSLRTWAFDDNIDRVHLALATEGRPLNSNVELWNGPDYTPTKIKIYIEDGCLSPLNAVVETPRGSNTIAVFNSGNQEFPFAANVEGTTPEGRAIEKPQPLGSPEIIQGGALRTYPFDPNVESVMVNLETDGRDLNARIELLQGPNNVKQAIEFYSSDGLKRSFCGIIEMPGSGNVVRIVNLKPVEFPFVCFIGPHRMESGPSGPMQPSRVGGDHAA